MFPSIGNRLGCISKWILTSKSELIPGKSKQHYANYILICCYAASMVVNSFLANNNNPPTDRLTFIESMGVY